ncbi:PREDICTED: uncharacterized protein LOC109480225 [Branchiostoma belcheri]|uniref:Uncharacterized protein LOC109480225 n=1 Tax=Branchiostoma belcheri TaxID=7741 RepID=A0A6P4ZMD1_BRABE|nr:PREDICTED: uncharacterized protein LOC109480225 [Branchiostoma belcheri]
MIFDLPGTPVSTRARQLKKFRTLDGGVVITISCANFNGTVGKMLVVWDGQENPLPFILNKTELDFEWSKRGEKLSNTEFDKIIDLIERLLQGIPNSEMQPLPVSMSRKEDIRDKLLPVQNQEDENSDDSDPNSDPADESSGNYAFLEMQRELDGAPVEWRQQEEGLQMIKWFREAEHAGFLPEEVQAALLHCGNANPVDWLKANWRELVASTAAQATEEGKKLRANIVGVITTQEAAEALRKQEGDIAKSIKECIDSRRKKFVQMMQDHDFEQDQVLTALQENGGDKEKAILAIQREKLRPFEEHIWRADENPQRVELKDGDHERNVRMVLCQFSLPSWECAETAVELIASEEYDFGDSIAVVRICDDLETCKGYLKYKSSHCARFPWSDLSSARLSRILLSKFLCNAGDPQFARESIYRKVMCMLLHALRDCTNKSNCPVRRVLTEAYADFVITSGQNEQQAIPPTVLEGLCQRVETTLGQPLINFSLPQLLSDEEKITRHQAEMLLTIIEFTPTGYTEALEAIRGAGVTADLREVLHVHGLNYPSND